MTALPLSTPTAETLQAHAQRLRSCAPATLDADDPDRAAALRREGCGLEIDFSRQLLDRPTLDALLELAATARLPAAMEALQSGAHVNPTEDRPALHSALRAAPGANDEVDAARARMREWTERLRAGQVTGFRGDPISDVVNIGIGGSDLGPRLLAEALGDADGPRTHFVANVDPADLRACLATLDPARTLFIICSKSFRTEETRVNGEAARAWVRAAGAGDADVARHFLAISSNLDAAAAFGIPAAQCLPMWDWVGGRFSLWSAVGLSAAIAMGWDAFDALLRGAAAMDQHALSAPPSDNLPMLCALLDCWNSHFLGAETLAVLPYAQRLDRLPDYLQQLVMESNGKSVDLEGRPLQTHSAPILWGSAGTIGQHSFHQLLHQGTRLAALELILPLHDSVDPAQHARLVAHCLAQSAVFANGRSAASARADLLERGESPARADELAPHLAMPGSRPHSLVSFPRLDAQVLGALLALWEHRTYFNACLLGINAFDQWGVELGKVVSEQIQRAMGGDNEAAQALDATTRRQLERWQQGR